VPVLISIVDVIFVFFVFSRTCFTIIAEGFQLGNVFKCQYCSTHQQNHSIAQCSDWMLEHWTV